MSKFAQKLIAVVALLSCVALVGAQNGGGGGQGRRGGFQGRRGGFGNTEMSLAMRADVQKELNVTDDQKTKLTDLQTKQREARRAQGGGRGAGGQQVDQAERQKLAAERRAQEKKDLAAILNDGQMKRLSELLLQREGYGALNSEDTQKALGLSSDQIAKIKDLQAKQQDANRALFEKFRNQEITQEELQADQEKNRKTLNDELAKILTSDQAAKFKDMQGKAFTFENTNGGGGR